ncbi:hypothetical protein E1301_Tti009508 [Triplophysa tibetana]|uniref:Uncharacterized protein n=1 Tax=Triplophysa tibetana TaxID=1572043 RepID=A0A5A9P5V5_9TELE|nr:hypothetical protein E1301_Tti009508 [Triplophysa tibetana]
MIIILNVNPLILHPANTVNFTMRILTFIIPIQNLLIITHPSLITNITLHFQNSTTIIYIKTPTQKHTNSLSLMTLHQIIIYHRLKHTIITITSPRVIQKAMLTHKHPIIKKLTVFCTQIPKVTAHHIPKDILTIPMQNPTSILTHSPTTKIILTIQSLIIITATTTPIWNPDNTMITSPSTLTISTQSFMMITVLNLVITFFTSLKIHIIIALQISITI